MEAKLNDFTILINPIPEGQKNDLNLDLPMIEVPNYENFHQYYYALVDFYRQHLGKKTVLIYTDRSQSTLHQVFHNISDCDSDALWEKMILNDGGFSCQIYISVAKPFLSLRSDYYNGNQHSLSRFLERMIDYQGWNVVMISGDQEKHQYHVDRIYLKKS